MIRSFASHVTVFTFGAALHACLGCAQLLTVAINGARLVTSLSSSALLVASPLAVLITLEG